MKMVLAVEFSIHTRKHPNAWGDGSKRMDRKVPEETRGSGEGNMASAAVKASEFERTNGPKGVHGTMERRNEASSHEIRRGRFC